MSIHYDVPQNSEAWERLRLGIPTASEFHKIICPALGKEYACEDCGTVYERPRKTCGVKECGGDYIREFPVVKKSSQASAYMNRLLAEWWFGAPLEDRKQETQWMARGHYLEPEGVGSYEFERSVRVQEAGFFTTDDDGLVGVSPDRLVGEDGLLEQKCPSPWVHMGYMRARDVDADYKVQLYGQLWITGRKWVDIQSYCPPFPTVIIRVERDEEYIRLLAGAVEEFVTEMLTERERLEKEYGPRTMAVGEIPARDQTIDSVDMVTIFGNMGGLGE